MTQTTNRCFPKGSHIFSSHATRCDALSAARMRFGFYYALALLIVLPLPLRAGPLDDLEPGHWYQVSNSKLQAVFPSPTPPGWTGPRAVMDAWSGGAYDSNRDRLIVWGGGHCDYAGNELYVFDIQTLSWSRLTEPSTTIAEGVSHYPDGLPSSRHTYDMLSYVPETGKFVSVGGGAGYFCDQPQNYINSTDLFNFALNRWERAANHPSIGNSTGRVSAYDAATGHVWAHGTYDGKLAEYNPVADTWKAHGSQTYLEIDGKAAIDAQRHEMLVVGGYGGNRQILLWDLDNPAAGPKIPSTSGDRTLETQSGIGLVYDPVSDRYVGWDGGSSVYTLNPDTWVWTKVDPATSNSVQGPAANENGTYGRFQYIPSQNAFVVVSRTDGDVFFYKLTEGGGQAPGAPAPTVSMDADPDAVTEGNFVTIFWTTADATTCVASGDWTGTKAVSSSSEEFSEAVGPLTSDSEFQLNCEGPGGTTSASVSVQVQSEQPLPTVDLNASASSVPAGEFVTLDWTATDATTCEAGGAWSGMRATSDSETVGPLQEDKTFTLQCSGAGGSATDSVTISIQASAGGDVQGEVRDQDQGGGVFGFFTLAMLLVATGWRWPAAARRIDCGLRRRAQES